MIRSIVTILILLLTSTASAERPEPEVHGVFDGRQNEIVAVIDEAFVRAQQGGRDVKQERDGSRTIYTVDLKRRIGYVGGQKGNQLDHPPATKLRIVLEEKNVITAYPVGR